MNFRIGTGFDVHKLIGGEPLIIGGVKIPHYKGTIGHSDGDVLIHAIVDAILGAVNERDIGWHFPDYSQENKNRDSSEFLLKTAEIMREKGYEISNIDSTIIAQMPKFKDYIPQMKQKLAEVLNINVDCISIKATTTEKLNFEGKEKGISVQAVALVYRVL